MFHLQNSPSLARRNSPVPSPPKACSQSMYTPAGTVVSDLPQQTTLDQDLQRLNLQWSGVPPSAYSTPTYPQLLQKNIEGSPVVLQTQRSSPPPLHIIKEDAIDDSSSPTLRPSSRPSSRKTSREEDAALHDAKKYLNPQISITDTQGHVIPMSTNQEDVMLTEDDVAHTTSTYVPSANTPNLVSWSPTLLLGQYGGLYMPPLVTQSYSMEAYYAAVVAAQAASTLPITNHHHHSNATSGIMDRLTSRSADSSFFNSNQNHYQWLDLASSAVSNTNPVEGALNLCNGLPENLRHYLSTVNLSTKKTVTDVLQEVKRAIDQYAVGGDLVYEHANNCFLLRNASVQMQMEVCHGDTERALKIQKLAGDAIHYNLLCNQLISCMNL